MSKGIRSENILEAALAYTEKGYSVFRLHGIGQDGKCTCPDPKCDKQAGKHPDSPHGLKDATTDPALIRKWFTEKPYANIGICTGELYDVLDKDPRNGGDGTYDSIRDQCDVLEAAPTVETGGGGNHYFLEPGKPPRKCKNGFLPGLDFKSTGGYVIAPPSLHKSGKRYRWVEGKALGEVPLAEAPRVIINALNQKQPTTSTRAKTTHANSCQLPKSPAPPSDTLVTEGGRNDFLTRIGGTLRAKGLTPDELESVLLLVNQTKLQPPLAPDEVKQIATSIGRYEPGDRRGPRPGENNYAVHDGAICRRRLTNKGEEHWDPLCNFDAEIVREQITDDGVERKGIFEIKGRHQTGRNLPTIKLGADKFNSMTWVNQWGVDSIVYAGQSTKDHLRVGIQIRSGRVVRIIVYAHTGWRNHEQHGWIYLFSGGAISANGYISDINVNLGGAKMDAYHLLPPPTGDALIKAVRSALTLLSVGPRRLTVPLLAAVFRSILGEAATIDFTVFYSGPSGTFKTELSVLGLSFMGCDFNSRNLPGNWSSTENALEKLNFTTKDAPVIIDDFAPTGTQSDIQRYHMKADRVLRSQGNKSGRLRMNPDGSLRPEFISRGLVISTGEDTPKGHSARARAMILEVSPGDISVSALSAAQKLAREGVLASVMSGFVQWLAPRMDDLKKTLPDMQRELRDAMPNLSHRRTPEIVASLELGLREFLRFAEEIEAISHAEAQQYLKEGHEALVEAAESQGALQRGEEPAIRALSLLSAGFITGRCHLVDVKTGQAPASPDTWGWHTEPPRSDGPYSQPTLRSRGDRIGWLDSDEVLLEPDAAYAIIQRSARDQNEAFEISKNTLWKRLAQKGLLITSDTEKKNVVKRTVEGQRRSVIAISAQHLADTLTKTGTVGTRGPDTHKCGTIAPTSPTSNNRPPVPKHELDADGLI